MLPEANLQNHFSFEVKLDQEIVGAAQPFAQRGGGGATTLSAGAVAVVLYRYTGADSIRLVLKSENKDQQIPSGDSTLLETEIDVSDDPTSDVLLHCLHDVIEQRHAPEVSAQGLNDSSLRKGPFAAAAVVELDISVDQAKLTIVSPLVDRARPADESSIHAVFTFDGTALTISLESGKSVRRSLSLEHMAGHLHRSLQAIIAGECSALSQLDLITPKEWRLLASDDNATIGYPDGAVPQLFERQVEQRPDALALRWDSRSSNYRELNEDANRLAHYLRGMGVGEQDLVGICLHRSSEAVKGMLAIMKAGAGYVPLDPTYPKQRLDEIARQAQIKVIVTSSSLTNRLPANIRSVCVDTEQEPIAAESSSNLQLELRSESLAYVMYTSGSTGKPKGVVGIHGSITNGLNGLPFQKNADEVCLLSSPLSLGFSISRIFLPLLSGVPVVILPDGHEQNLDEFTRVCEQQSVTNIALVPSALAQILTLGDVVLKRMQRVRTVVTGGERASAELISAFRTRMPQARLVTGYAATEIGGAALTRVLTDASDYANSVGRPFSNTRIYILDQKLNPVPFGVAGELCIAADHLSRGYLNEPEQTAERFASLVLESKVTRRVYRTGDLGRYLPNGEVEYLGRRDEQVKIRGFRVELAEIASALRQYSGISEVAVVGHTADIGNRLVGYIVARSGISLSVRQLREYLQQRLPDFMIPAVFMFIEAIPLTAAGKLDRAALPEPLPARPALDTPYEPPRNELETTIARLWSEVLQVEPIGIYDDFLELGGDSLVASQIMSRLQETFEDVSFELSTLFDFPTVSHIAAHISPQIAVDNRFKARGD